MVQVYLFHREIPFQGRQIRSIEYLLRYTKLLAISQVENDEYIWQMACELDLLDSAILTNWIDLHLLKGEGVIQDKLRLMK